MLIFPYILSTTHPTYSVIKKYFVSCNFPLFIQFYPRQALILDITFCGVFYEAKWKNIVLDEKGADLV
jgi:hypothetical protein